MKTNMVISEENSQVVANQMTKLLADDYVLYTKTRNAHWNVEGADFYDKHRLFQSLYDQLDKIIDTVAEPIRSLEHYAPSTLKEFLSLSHVTELEQSYNSATSNIKELSQDHEIIA